MHILSGKSKCIGGSTSRERERDYMVLAHESFVLAWFLRISNQPINLVTTASNEDPCADPESFVRGGPTLQL